MSDGVIAILLSLQDQKNANGLRQNGHAKMSAAKPVFHKHNNGKVIRYKLYIVYDYVFLV